MEFFYVVVSEYANQAHNFKNMIIYDLALFQSIWVPYSGRKVSYWKAW